MGDPVLEDFRGKDQARYQHFMRGGANETKVDQTTEMYFLLSDRFIYESSNTWEIVTENYMVGTEYYICRIQLFELSYREQFYDVKWYIKILRN